MMKIEVVIPAAGEGKRLNTKTSKIFIKIRNTPLIVYTLRPFEAYNKIKDIILVVKLEDILFIEKLIKKYKLKKIKCIVAGGENRQDSVRKGLEFLDKDTDYVIIHDGSRPFLHLEDLKKIISAVKKYNAVVLGVPVRSTIKQIDKSLFINSTLPRDLLWEAYTPQAFERKLILKAHRKFKGISSYDDATLVERLGYKVKIEKSSYLNLKITYPEDLVFAQRIATLF
jgi:2-C-methyl-D-erythritol 4-phosphate cytidylyltransferase